MQAFTLFDDATRLACEHVSVPSLERISILNAVGRTLGRPACACIDMPPFARSMMDGFAVRHQDTLDSTQRLSIVGDIPAGHTANFEIGPLQSARIMTGAPFPAGADAVARMEWCEDDGSSVRILRPVSAGESVQVQGEDGRRGDVLVRAGTRLTGRHLAVLQAFGVDELDVFVRPRATILATGSELVSSPGQALQPGQIYASNHWFLRAALEEDGYEVVNVRFIEDHPASLEAAMREAIETSDVVLTTGGVSVGRHDYMREVAMRCEVEVAVERVWMRPGSPLLIGRKGKTAVFAMSGNPAACFVQFDSVVRPALRAVLGQSSQTFTHSGVLSHPVDLKAIKHVRILCGRTFMTEGTLQVDVQLAQSPGVISSLLEATCLVRLDESSLPAGALVPVHLIAAP